MGRALQLKALAEDEAPLVERQALKRSLPKRPLEMLLDTPVVCGGLVHVQQSCMIHALVLFSAEEGGGFGDSFYD
jgi:hypothetical protein